MALLKTINGEDGETITDAYHKIVRTETRFMGKDATLSVQVLAYRSKEAADGDKRSVWQDRFDLGTVNKDEPVLLSECYEKLKTHERGDFISREKEEVIMYEDGNKLVKPIRIVKDA